jgi:hypothetical protein
LSALIAILAGRGPTLDVRAIWIRRIGSADTGRPRTLNGIRGGVRIGGRVAWRGTIGALLVELIIIGPLLTTASHTNITTNPNSTTLLGNDPAQGGAGGQTRELLGAEYGERDRDDFEAEIQERFGRGGLSGVDGGRERSAFVEILGVLGFLIQVEVEPIHALVADRKIGKDEVTGLGWTIEVCNSGHGHTSQNGTGWGRGESALRHGTCRIQRCEQEEIGIISKGDVGLVNVVVGIGLEDAQLHDRRGINRTTIGRGFEDRN